MAHVIELIVNSQKNEVLVKPNELLVDVLRDKLSLTGTKKGCGAGDCGACTVLVEGEPILSCLTLAVSCHGRSIETIASRPSRTSRVERAAESRSRLRMSSSRHW